MKNLHTKIISSFEQKHANFRGLKGLHVKMLKRVMKKSESIALGQSMAESKLKQSQRNTDIIN